MKTETLKAELYKLGVYIDDDEYFIDIDYTHETAIYTIAQVSQYDVGVIDTNYANRDVLLGLNDEGLIKFDNLNEVYELLFKYTMTPIKDR